MSGYATTPGPYEAEGNKIKSIDHGRWFTLADCRNNNFTPEGQKLHAAYFAHAGNCHEELRDALKGLFEHCAMIHKHWGDNCNQAEATKAIEAAKTALAKAEREPLC